MRLKGILALFISLFVGLSGVALAEVSGPIYHETIENPVTYPYYSSSEANNIGVNGTVCMEAYVKIKNTAEWSKFIITNPYFDITVYRGEEEEHMGEIDDLMFMKYYDVFGYLPGTKVANDINLLTYRVIPKIMMLNYYNGFWLDPNSEALLKVEACFPLEVYDFPVKFPYAVEINETNSEEVSWKFITDNSSVDDINIIYASLRPELITYPQYVFDLKDIFTRVDDYIEVLEYNATVTITLKDTATELTPYFRSVFAISAPIIFPDAEYTDFKIDGFIDSRPTATFDEFFNEILPRYTQKPEVGDFTPKKVYVEKKTLAKVSSGLLTNSKPIIKKSLKEDNKYDPMLDFPVWIVWLEDEISIQYSVHWDPSTVPSPPEVILTTSN